MVKIEVAKTEAVHSSAEKNLSSELHQTLSKEREVAQEKLQDNEADQSHRKREAEQQVAELAKTKEDHQKHETTETKQHDMPKSRTDKEYGFRATMHTVQKDMSSPERQFSKFIHRPIVEKASEVAGKTVARPSGIAGASIAAFVGILMIYGIAKYVGFTLSGSEMPILLAIGFIIGLIGEWLYKSFRSIVLN